jgi:5-formyltetrahydrofolate cyclo-ligase
LATKDRKREMRAAAAALRAAAAERAGATAAVRVRDRVLAEIPMRPGAVVSAYWPMRDELDPRPTLDALHLRGHGIGLPVVIGAGRPLVFRAWRPGDRLEEAAFQTMVPTSDAAEVRPDVLLVPLLAFDREGYRLGYGGGFYDRTLAQLRAVADVVAVGVAYAGQEQLVVPHEATDQRLDWIVTEAETIAIDRGARP